MTEALNAYFAGLHDGALVVFPTRARYRVEGTVLVSGKRNILIDGRGATFFAATDGGRMPPPSCGPDPTNSPSSACRYPDRTRAHWTFVGVTNLAIRNVNVIGSDSDPGPNGRYDPALEAQHGFNIVTSNSVNLDHVSVRNVWGDFIYIGGVSQNVTVRNSSFDGASRQGISVTSADSVLIESNRLTNARRSMFDLEANTGKDRITNVTVRNNDVGPSRFCTFNNVGAGAIEHDITFDGNRIHDKILSVCVWGRANARRSRYRITNNVGGDMANEPSIALMHVDGAFVSGNTQRLYRGEWPARGGIVQAPVVSKCSTGIRLGTNAFAPLPHGLSSYAERECSR